MESRHDVLDLALALVPRGIQRWPVIVDRQMRREQADRGDKTSYDDTRLAADHNGRSRPRGARVQAAEGARRGEAPGHGRARPHHVAWSAARLIDCAGCTERKSSDVRVKGLRKPVRLQRKQAVEIPGEDLLLIRGPHAQLLQRPLLRLVDIALPAARKE